MRDLKDYLKLPYTLILRHDEEGDVVARVEELPGCVAHGKTRKEALENIEEALEVWLDERIKSGYPVPEPEDEEPLPSGKWVQRIPRSLHKKLAKLAKNEGVSLNQLVTSIIAESVGIRIAGEIAKIKAQDIWSAYGVLNREVGGEQIAGPWVIRHIVGRQGERKKIRLTRALDLLTARLPNKFETHQEGEGYGFEEAERHQYKQ